MCVLGLEPLFYMRAGAAFPPKCERLSQSQTVPAAPLKSACQTMDADYHLPNGNNIAPYNQPGARGGDQVAPHHRDRVRPGRGRPALEQLQGVNQTPPTQQFQAARKQIHHRQPGSRGLDAIPTHVSRRCIAFHELDKMRVHAVEGIIGHSPPQARSPDWPQASGSRTPAPNRGGEQGAPPRPMVARRYRLQASRTRGQPLSTLPAPPRREGARRMRKGPRARPAANGSCPFGSRREYEKHVSPPYPHAASPCAHLESLD